MAAPTPRLPAAAEGVVKLHESEGFLLLSGHQGELRTVKIGVVGEHFEEAGGAGRKAHAGEADGVGGGAGFPLLLFAIFARLRIGRESVRDVAECARDRLLISVEQFLMLGQGQTIIPANFTTIEDGLSKRGGGVVIEVARGEDAEQPIARAASGG